jgi:predicted solute-binding protein
MQKHIQLYVNEYSVSLGDEGRKAIDYLFERNNLSSENIFVDL